VAKAARLIADDTRTNPLLHQHPAIADLGIRAYAGRPLITTDGALSDIESQCNFRIVRSGALLQRLGDDGTIAWDELAKTAGMVGSPRSTGRRPRQSDERAG
jgi:hypothetical protein